MDPVELLGQADRLVDPAGGPVSDADLRRAVSAAYYAVFHHFVRAGVRHRLGATPRVPAVSDIAARAYGHDELRAICSDFGNGPGAWKSWMRALLVGTGFTVPDALRSACRRAVVLQQLRHDSDYNPALRLTRLDAVEAVSRARQAITEFDAAAGTPGHDFFLACLTDWKTLRTRGG